MTGTKPIILLLGMLLVFPSISRAADYSRADCLFKVRADYKTCRDVLDSLYKISKTDKEKAEVLWRLSRVCLVTDNLSEGKEYAEQAMKLDPGNPGGYMWHCACVGIECQKKSLIEQARAVPIMLGDLETILEKLGRTDYSEAWQAKAEIYYHHPFKSNDDAIEYMRKCVATIPKDELRISSSLFLAKILYERNWSASRRGGTLSDRAEAKQVLENARERYLSASVRSAVDEKDYEELLKALKSYRK